MGELYLNCVHSQICLSALLNSPNRRGVTRLAEAVVVVVVYVVVIVLT